MPYTKNFLRIRRKYSNEYKDKARAETFAFMKAFELKIPTFKDKEKKYKKIK